MDVRENYINETFMPKDINERGRMFPKTTEVEIRLEWCEQELGYQPRHVQIGYHHRFYFENEVDMMAYILRWK